MLRNLFLIVCLIGATNAIAQHPASPSSKTTEKQDDAKIDYKVAGTPMPPLRVLLYRDTSSKKDTMVNAHSNPDRKKAHKEKHAEEKLYLTDKDLDNGANLIVMMFNPTCSHCQDETAILEKNIFLFNKTQMVLLANPTMKAYLPDFVNMLHVMEYPSMHVGIDSSGFINNVYQYTALPQINIYDKERKLIKIYNGEVSVDTLKKYIE